MRLTLQIVVCFSLLATFVSTLRVYPHQLAYFNELSGGPGNGHRHLLGSSLNNGQDLLLLKEWADSKGVDLAAQRLLLGSDPCVELLSHEAEPRNPRLEIVNADLMGGTNSPWTERLDAAGVERIGYTIWAFSKADEQTPRHNSSGTPERRQPPRRE
jgi:hypothetical protein